MQIKIAERVGIKAPSLYKHYKNKQAIFDAIIDEMNHRFDEQAQTLSINGTDPNADAEAFINMDEDRLVKLGTDLFKGEALETGIPYQTLINLYLVDCVKSKRKLEIAWK